MSFSFLTTVGWYLIQGYTQLSMWWQKYVKFTTFVENVKTSEFPFNVIEKDNMYQIYYPVMTKTEYNFIQVQVEIGGQKYDIDSKPFMVVGNRLFDRPFTDWVMRFYHDLAINHEEEYSVHIIDQDVNFLKLSPKDFIEVNKDNYLKKSLEE